MTKKSDIKSGKNWPTFGREIGAKAARKLEAQRNTKQGIWLGLGKMGIIGWSVVVPALLGVAFGIWLDNRYQGSSYSWTLMLMIIGLALGCLNAWHWVTREIQEMHRKEEKKDE